jgi:hypothetical protein
LQQQSEGSIFSDSPANAAANRRLKTLLLSADFVFANR